MIAKAAILLLASMPLASCAPAVPAFSDPTSTAYLLRDCEAASVSQEHCSRFVFTSMMTPNTTACIPDGVRIFDLTDNFIKWARAHPEQWNTPDHVGISRSMAARWPCA